MEFWLKKDPIKGLKKVLIKENIADIDDFKKIDTEIEKELDESLVFAHESPEPKPEDTFEDLYNSMEVPR